MRMRLVCRLWIALSLVASVSSFGLAAEVLQVGLSWTAPQTNKDGTPLTDLVGYGICISDQTIPDDRGLADCSTFLAKTTLDNVVKTPVSCTTSTGKCYFRVFAQDVDDNQSSLSNEDMVDTGTIPEAPSVLRIELIIRIAPTTTHPGGAFETPRR